MSFLRTKTAKYDVPSKIKETGLYPFFKVISANENNEVLIEGEKKIMFGSNSYLGLTDHPKIKEATKKAIDKYGTGCSGSRIINGTLDIHLELEEKIAKFIGKEAALTFSTGFQVNIGVIPAVAARNDYILLDRLDHASIIEGARLSFGKTFKFNHNDMDSLEEKLKSCQIDKLKLIVVDGIFSMDGDISDLPGIVKLAEKYNATIMVDDAHALGVIGDGGRGTCSHFGLNDEVDLIMGTFSKSLASLGGFIASDKDTINFLKHNSRSSLFSASMTPASTASTLAALEILQNEPERLEKLWENTNYSNKVLKDNGFDIGNSVSPIIPIFIRDDAQTFLLTKKLLDAGIFVTPVVSPGVSSDSSLIRFALMATHTKQQLDFALGHIIKISKEIGVI